MRRQADKPCPNPKCGSMHRIGDNCNLCGTYAPVPKEFYVGEKTVWKKGKAPVGEGWDKKAHKIIRRN